MPIDYSCDICGKESPQGIVSEIKTDGPVGPYIRSWRPVLCRKCYIDLLEMIESFLKKRSNPENVL